MVWCCDVVFFWCLLVISIIGVLLGLDIRDPARAAQRRREPQCGEDAAAPRCMLGSRCELAAFSLSCPCQICAYCGARVCAACRTNQIEIDRWCTQNNEVKWGSKGKTELKRVCDSCCEHAPAEVRQRRRGIALTEVSPQATCRCL